MPLMLSVNLRSQSLSILLYVGLPLSPEFPDTRNDQMAFFPLSLHFDLFPSLPSFMFLFFPFLSINFSLYSFSPLVI